MMGLNHFTLFAQAIFPIFWCMLCWIRIKICKQVRSRKRPTDSLVREMHMRTYFFFKLTASNIGKYLIKYAAHRKFVPISLSKIISALLENTIINEWKSSFTHNNIQAELFIFFLLFIRIEKTKKSGFSACSFFIA